MAYPASTAKRAQLEKVDINVLLASPPSQSSSSNSLQEQGNQDLFE
jgi:hypothetical protein